MSKSTVHQTIRTTLLLRRSFLFPRVIRVNFRIRYRHSIVGGLFSGGSIRYSSVVVRGLVDGFVLSRLVSNCGYKCSALERLGYVLHNIKTLILLSLDHSFLAIFKVHSCVIEGASKPILT